MNEQAEKLVEEFREAFECYYDVCMDIQFGQDDRDVYIEQRAEHLIDCVGQAYADGMPLPGEEGPRWGIGTIKVLYAQNGSHDLTNRTLIILRPPLGTGKEEGGE